jgi:hypothetical protein
VGALTDAVDRHRPRTVPVWLCPDAQLADELHVARADLVNAARRSSSLDTTAVQQAKARVDELQAKVDTIAVEFVLQQIPRPDWRALSDRHQPSKAVRERYREQGIAIDFDPDSFPPAAIAACLVSPREDTDEATAAAVRSIFETWGEGECERLWQACLAANVDVSAVPKSAAVSATTSGSAPKSAPPTSSESLAPSSSDAS